MPVGLAVVPSTTETFMLIESLLANTSLVHLLGPNTSPKQMPASLLVFLQGDYAALWPVAIVASLPKGKHV
jgi:hypothetical protein